MPDSQTKLVHIFSRELFNHVYQELAKWRHILKASGAPPESGLEMFYQFSMLDWLFQDRSSMAIPHSFFVYICHTHNSLNTALWTSQEPCNTTQLHPNQTTVSSPFSIILSRSPTTSSRKFDKPKHKDNTESLRRR